MVAVRNESCTEQEKDADSVPKSYLELQHAHIHTSLMLSIFGKVSLETIWRDPYRQRVQEQRLRQHLDPRTSIEDRARH